MYSHIRDARHGGRDKPLREFVREFKGLTSTQKAASVCAQFPGVSTLSVLEGRKLEVDRLLAAMKEASSEPKPDCLGFVGETHFRARFGEWHKITSDSFLYKRVAGVEGGIPFVIEAASAAVIPDASDPEPGHVYQGTNFSPSFGDPFADTILGTPEFAAAGVGGFLMRAHATGEHRWGIPAVAAVHVVAPALTFLDRGNTRLSVTKDGPMVRALEDALWAVTKRFYKEGERRRKSADREVRALSSHRRPDVSLKDAIFEVLAEAYDRGTGGKTGLLSVRDLYYEVRPLYERLTGKPLEEPNDNGKRFKYFGQTLLPEYRRTRDPLPLLFYKPRGVLYEPHTGRETQIGTRSVDSYTFPLYRYDKILWIEKEGIWETLKPSGIAERFDMAVIASEGYATEAMRTLIERAAEGQQYRIFALHDADPHGYNIYRTLREATVRMPNHQVEVHDLGLTVKESLDMGLLPEKFSSEKSLPAGLKLTTLERDYFSKRRERFELNAIHAPDRAEFITRKLVEAGATDKVIPPDEYLGKQAETIYQKQLRSYVADTVAGLIDLEAITSLLADEYRDKVLTDPRRWIDETFEQTPTASWDAAIESGATDRLQDHSDGIKARIAQQIASKLSM